MKKLFLMATVFCLLTASFVIAQTTEGKLTVQGVCGMCKARIEKAALGVSGVAKAEWELETKVLALQFDSGKTNLDAISKAVAKVGHDTDRDGADDKVYAALPDCCKYRDAESESEEHHHH